MTDEQEDKRTTGLFVQVDRLLHTRLKVLAEMRGTTLKVLVQGFIQAGLDKACEVEECQ